MTKTPKPNSTELINKRMINFSCYSTSESFQVLETVDNPLTAK